MEGAAHYRKRLSGAATQDVKAVLYTQGLKAIEKAGESRGANLIVDPTLDLRDPPEREEQVNRWMQQIALDAGLAGMEAFLLPEKIHE